MEILATYYQLLSKDVLHVCNSSAKFNLKTPFFTIVGICCYHGNTHSITVKKKNVYCTFTLLGQHLCQLSFEMLCFLQFLE